MPAKKRKTMADKKAEFRSRGLSIRYELAFRYVTNVINRSREEWFYLTGRKIWRHAKKNIRAGDPNHHKRNKKTKSRKFGKPFEYSDGRISKSITYAKVPNEDVVLIGPQGNPKSRKNILSGIPRSHDATDTLRPLTPLSVLAFGGRSKQADREPDADDKFAADALGFKYRKDDLISVAEWRDKKRPVKHVDVTARPFMQMALWKVMSQKETIKNFTIRP